MVKARAGTGARRLAAAAVLLGIALGSAVPAAGEQDLLQGLLQELRRSEERALPEGRAPLDLRRMTSELEMGAELLLRLYQVLLSSQDGPRCQFTPSCSEYARIAVRRHGLLLGLLMASDRYQRCNGLERERYPLDPRTGKRLDPPPEPPAGLP
jgi:hypothetical protein